MSLVMPFISICLPVMPLLQRARKIHETFVWIYALSIVLRALKRFMIPFSSKSWMLSLDKAKWTKASVLKRLMLISCLGSMHKSIIMSITLYAISS